jgi:iron-sulfur cluster assembly protein
MNFEVTEKAAKQLISVQAREGKQDFFLRVSVVGGGCSGFSYKMSFEDKQNEGDKVFEHFGVKVLIDPKSLLFLDKTQLDFSDGLNGQGFTFQNPNAKTTCGCGSSFSA